MIDELRDKIAREAVALMDSGIVKYLEGYGKEYPIKIVADALDEYAEGLREVLLLVFRDTHAAGTAHFNRDTISCYTAEKVRKVLGINEEWLVADAAMQAEADGEKKR